VTPTPATGSAAETSTTKTPATKTEEKKDGAATTPTPGELYP